MLRSGRIGQGVSIFKKIMLPAKMSTARRRTAWHQNYSPALFLPVTLSTLQEHASSPRTLLTLSRVHILEHAARRADLFFYILIGCYRRRYVPLQSRTTLQHGKGKGLTQACHSSLFPGLFIRQQGEIDRLLFNRHFNHCLNATVELPEQVNRLDDVLETRLKGREKMLDVIRHVATDNLRPEEGMREFFIMMEKNLSVLEQALPSGDDVSGEKYLIGLVHEGTFTHHWDLEQQKVRPEYIAMILRLYGLDLNEAVIDRRMLEIQAELHTEFTP